ncbi:MAG: site-specific integrase [Lentilitoribacter sp.]
MYLTRRQNGFRFQRRIPKKLEPVLGKSPIRIHIGNLPARDATRIARLLAGHSDLLFQELEVKGYCALSDKSDTTDDIDPRDATIARLRKQLNEAINLLLDYSVTSQKTIEMGERLSESKLKKLEAQMVIEALEREATHSKNLKRLGVVLERFKSQALNNAKELYSLRQDSRYTDFSSQLESLTSMVSEIKESVDQNLETEIKRPLTTDALEDWHHNIRLKEGINAKKTTTDYNRIKDFIAFAGDQSVNKYKFDQFQKYAIMLAAVPSNYNKKPDLRDMSLEEVSAYNQNLSDNERLETLSAKTIETNYLSPLRVFFKDMGNQYEFTSPVVDNKFRLPTFTKGTVDRKPFTVDELNKWFAVSAIAKQPDMKWMPLLGAFTGARVGELVTLQKKDVYKVESGGWVIDLTTDIIDADGAARVRMVKNASSRRIIALPEFVIKTGFIDYVKTIPRDGNLFPGCFYHGKTRVKDPAGAVSKRLNAQLKNAGLHSNIETTFHSTRHTAKDLMRTAKIDERTHDKQTGHSNKTVSRNYGAMNLLDEEIKVLRALPVPEGLDLSPYLSDK